MHLELYVFAFNVYELLTIKVPLSKHITNVNQKTDRCLFVRIYTSTITAESPPYFFITFTVMIVKFRNEVYALWEIKKR